MSSVVSGFWDSLTFVEGPGGHWTPFIPPPPPPCLTLSHWLQRVDLTCFRTFSGFLVLQLTCQWSRRAQVVSESEFSIVGLLLLFSVNADSFKKILQALV